MQPEAAGMTSRQKNEFPQAGKKSKLGFSNRRSFKAHREASMDPE